jgi:protein-disulfide isomerase
MDKKFLIILTVIVLGLFGIFAYTKHSKPVSNQATSAKVTTSQHSKGENTKNVELLVYGDFQCPVCAKFYPIEDAILQTFGNNIKFTFRHFPIDTVHPNARAAHRTAEAAGLQGKFFEMYDLLYKNHTEWADASDPKSIFEQYASQLGLDMKKFNTDYASEQVNSTINADIAEGKSKSVNGTPTFFINGRKIENTELSSTEKFMKAIQDEINKNTKK